MSIQQRIKDRRLALSMTLAQVAYQVGISESTLSRYETSGIQNMGVDKLEKLAEVLKCSPAYLMGWEEKEPTPDVLFNDILIELKKSSPDVKQQVWTYINFLNRAKDEN